jgi:hypothetical protein
MHSVTMSHDQPPLNIEMYTPRFTMCEKVNREMLTFLLLNPTVVDATEKGSYQQEAVVTNIDDSKKYKTAYAKLVQYHARVMKDDRVEVSYEQGDESCRCFAEGVALQNLNRPLRHAITYGELHDYDMRAAAPTVIEALCKRHDIDCEAITSFIACKEDTLRLIMKARSCDKVAAKDEAHAVFFGGSCSSASSGILSRLKKCMKQVNQELKLLYPAFWQQSQNERSGLSLLYHAVENHCVQIIMVQLQKQHYTCSALIFDGVMTEERVTSAHLLECEAAVAADTGIQVQLVEKPIPQPEWTELYKCEKVCRPLRAVMFKSYEQVREAFETTAPEHFKVQEPPCLMRHAQERHETDDPLYSFKSKKALEDHYFDMYFYEYTATQPDVKESNDSEGEPEWARERPQQKKQKVEAKKEKQKSGGGRVEFEKSKFIPRWLGDEEKVVYEKCDFLPPPLHVPAGVRNLWPGFAVEHTPPATAEDIAAMEKYILPFLKEVICAKRPSNYRYLMALLAQMFQCPGDKTAIPATVLLGEEGVGKNRLTHLLGLMVGRCQHMQSTKLNNVVFARFSQIVWGKVLLILDELDPAEIRSYQRDLMDLITMTSRPGEKKGVQGIFTMRNFLRLFFSSNDEHQLIALPEKDRKYWFLEVSAQERGQIKEYFVPLMMAINTPGVRRAFYDHLLQIDFSNVNFQEDRPKSELYGMSKEQTIRPEVQFLRHYLLQRKIVRDIRRQQQQQRAQQTDPQKEVRAIKWETADMFALLVDHKSKTSAGKALDYGMSVSRLGMAVYKLPGFGKDPHHGNRSSWIINVSTLVQYLEQIGLLVRIEREFLLAEYDGIDLFTEDSKKSQYQFVPQPIDYFGMEYADHCLDSFTINYKLFFSKVVDMETEKAEAARLASSKLNYKLDVGNI